LPGIIGIYVVARPGATGLQRWRARRGLRCRGGRRRRAADRYTSFAFAPRRSLSYQRRRQRQWTTGHATLGLNGGGFFGIGVPQLRQAADLLISPRGLFVVSPS